jgi:hypothetical protein
VVVRGPRVRRIRIAALDAASTPPTLEIEAELGGRRYVEDRDTAAVLSGSQDRTSTFSERWTLALDGPPEGPWRLVGVRSGGAVSPTGGRAPSREPSRAGARWNLPALLLRQPESDHVGPVHCHARVLSAEERDVPARPVHLKARAPAEVRCPASATHPCPPEPRRSHGRVIRPRRPPPA